MEKFFTAYFAEDGGLEGVVWSETKEEAIKYADEWKQKFPEDADNVLVGELLVMPKE